MRERIAWSQHRVNAAHPCPVCGKDHGLCALFPSREQVEEVLCARVDSGEWVDAAGAWKHRLTPQGAPSTSRPLPTPTPKAERLLAPLEVRERVYRRARELSEPLDRRRHLPLFTNVTRQMIPAQVEARGYFPFPTLADRYVDSRRRDNDGRWLLAARLVLEEGEATLGVPGFGQHKDGRPWCGGWGGILLPALDPQGRIAGGQVLTTAHASKGAPKYATLTGGGHQLHCSRPTGYGLAPIRNTGRVWLTEGLLKADIASDLLGEVVVAAAGQQFPAEALREYLEALEPSEVVVALDYDAPGSAARKKTDKNRRALADQLVALGYRVTVAVWEYADGKGIDDLLLAGGSPRLREHQPSRHRPRPVLDATVAPPPLDPRPLVAVDQQRQDYADTLREYLANRNGTAAQEVLLVRLAPGIGKTTGFAKVAKEYVDRDLTRTLIHVVPTHEVGHQMGADGWAQVYGRTSDKAPNGRPCHRTEHYQALSERGSTRERICRLCPLREDCKEKPRSDRPYYLGQFRRRQLTRLPAAHLLSPDLVAKCGGGPLVIDDVDLDQLSLSETWITEADLLESIAAARAEEPAEEGGPATLRPALSLLEILLDYRHALAVQGERKHGSDLVRGLATWCEENEHALDSAVAAALTAQSVDPLEGVRNLDAVKLDNLGPRPVARRIAEVLSVELQHLRDGRETWNSRLGTGNKPGRDSKAHGLCIEVREHRPLPLESYAGRPIVVLNASMTREQAERLFPGRKVRVQEPRAPLPAGVTITQYLDRRYGKTVLERDADMRRRAREEIRQVLERHAGQRVGLITHKGFADQLRNEPEFAGLTVLHYHGHRSMNTAAMVDAWIMLGTPHPREDSLVRATEALYWRDAQPLDHTVAPRSVELESVDGRRYQVQRRTALDTRLQEQLEQRTSLELEQALFRCRPHNLDAPEQGDLFRAPDRERRSSVSIYVFSPEPLGLPVHRVVTEADRLPTALDLVVAAGRDLVVAGTKPTQRAILAACPEGTSYRAVVNAVQWLRREHGPTWWEERESELAIPRAPRYATADEHASEEVLPTAPAPAPLPPPRPTSWSTVTTRIAEEAVAVPRAGAPPPSREEIWSALGEIL